MRKLINLSYCLNNETPVYPGDFPVSVKRVRRIKGGDTCNTSLIYVSSHAGTHIDVPYHFFEKGMRIEEYGTDGFIFQHPCVVECPKRAGEAVRPEDIMVKSNVKKSDIVILRTGFGRYRSKDAESYCHRNPYLSPEAAEYIVRNFPCMKAVGMDTVSISSKVNRASGREAHRILLGNGIVIIEDMRLMARIEKLSEVAVFPLFTCSPDGSPCVVIGVKDD